MAKTKAASNDHLRRRPYPPSPSILTVLASISASAFVNGHPLDCSQVPPEFLCPSIDYTDNVVSYPANQPGPSSYDRLLGLPAPVTKILPKRAIPDSYSRGDDGKWRKKSEWTFYGSSMCLCGATSVSTTDLASSGEFGSTASPNVFDSLPTGWVVDEDNSTRTALILSFSLVLACFISAFIVGCIFWRSSSKKRANKDPEKKIWSEGGGTNDEEKGFQAKTKSRLWAKASARWRDNIKHSARRRRNARLTSASSSQLNISNPDLTRPLSPANSSRTLASRSRSSSTTINQSPSDIIAADNESPHGTDISPSDPQLSPSTASPPDYQGDTTHSSSAPTSESTRPVEDSRENESSSPCHDQSPAHDQPPSDQEELPYTPALHAAHIATDDKNILQRMVVMGSEPPEDGDSRTEGYNVQGSAPILYDDDEERFEADSLPSECIGSPMFPAPPETQPSSKGKMAALTVYEYDDLDVEPPPGPSAPPFEASDPCDMGPSAPPFSINPTGPSAPALDEADSLNDALSTEDEFNNNRQAGLSTQDAPGNGAGPQADLLPQYKP